MRVVRGGGTLLGFGYTTTPAGTIAEETRTPTSPTSPRDFDYDPQGRIKQMTVAAGTPTSYSFDASGNATTLPTGASGSYDNASELTSSTLSSTTTNYTYDAAGNRTETKIGAVTQTSGSYNGANEVITYTDAAASMSSATYDGDSLRVASSNTIAGGSPVSQNYLWDTTAAVPKLLTDGTHAYVYANGSAPIEQIDLNTGNTTYLIADQLGSIRATVSASGTLGATTNYDAWGNPDNSGGLTSTTPFGYAASYTDPTGLIYLVHRYYDPQTGQFISVDPAVDTTEQPYAYAGDDPTNSIDPIGQRKICLFGRCVYTHPFDPSASLHAAVNIGREASFGLSDRIANWISPGASCTVSQNGFDRFLGSTATTLLAGAGATRLARFGVLKLPYTTSDDLSGALGETDPFGNIAVDSRLAGDELRETLLHEGIHSIYTKLVGVRVSQWTYSTNAGRVAEEFVAEAFATGRPIAAFKAALGYLGG